MTCVLGLQKVGVYNIYFDWFMRLKLLNAVRENRFVQCYVSQANQSHLECRCFHDTQKIVILKS